jgi:hypothetical protein
MDPQPGANAGFGARIWKWFSGWGFKEWRRAALVTVLACTASFGGLDTVNASVSTAKPGEQFTSGWITATIERATLVPQVMAGQTVLYPKKPDKRYLGVVARIGNDGNLPGYLRNVIELHGQPKSRFLGTMRLDDGTGVVAQGPGLADDIVFVWELPDDALAVGADVTLRIWKQVPRLNATYGEGWVPSLNDYTQVVVPVGGQR